jgi:hypothetical protein
MATAVHTPKTRQPKLAPEQPAVTPPTPAAAPTPGYAPDRWSLWFWFACAGLLILLHAVDWVNSLFSHLLK